MPVNEALAQNSTYAYVAAVTIYVLSMFFYLAETAFGRRPAARPRRPTSRSIPACGATGRCPSGSAGWRSR
jgi:hypothetical protein